MVDETVSESLVTTTAPTTLVDAVNVVTETATLVGDLIISFNHTASDVVVLTGAVTDLADLAVMIASDSLLLVDVVLPDYILRLVELLRVVDAVIPGGTQTVELHTGFSCSDGAVVSFDELVTDTTTVAEAVSILGYAARILRDKFIGSDSVLPNQVLTLLVSVGLAAYDVALAGYGHVLSEAFGVSDSHAARQLALSTLAETVGLADTLSPSLLLINVVDESLSTGDTTNHALDSSEVLSDTFQTIAVFTDGAEVYASYVMNSRNFGVTTYDGYNFNSYAKLGSTVLAANSSGLFSITGTDDNGSDIDWVVKTGKLDIGSGKHSRIEKVYMSGVADAKVVLKVTDGGEKERWYKSKTPRAGSDTIRFTTSRGAKALYWQFELVGSGDVLLEQLELYPIVLTRR